ncbi:MAG TPA: hypothetical protein VMY36_03540 [Patescibacteria group bacterium]|nr:hypothetical protein [Patescibacteria group bacterium]
MKPEMRQVEKELIRLLRSFRPNRKETKKRINILPFLGMVCGFIFGIVWLFYFWDEVKNLVPQHTYRFGAMGIWGFPIITTLIGIIVGKGIELLVRRLRN